MASHSKVKGESYTLGYLPSGAPQLLSGGLQSGYVSISHTDGLLAMAFSDVEVGIDVERADREVSSKVCKSIEDWTRIEAYAKWSGKGLSKDIIKSLLPDGIISTRKLGEYVISVCSRAQDVEISQLS